MAPLISSKHTLYKDTPPQPHQSLPMSTMKKYMHRITCHCNKGGGRRKNNFTSSTDEDGPEVSAEHSTTSVTYQLQKDSVVSIVLAGGTVEVYDTAVFAHHVMERHPGLRLARPEVFRRPHESMVSSRERLMPGEKFYLVPRSTIKKLKMKVERERDGGGEEEAASSPVREEEAASSPECEEGEGFSARDFYVSRERWTQCYAKRLGKEEEKVEKEERREFKRPILSNCKIKQGLLLGWTPGLTTIKESSP